MAAKTWTCKVASCRRVNEPRTRKCGGCGTVRPKRKRPAHMAALDVPYEEYIYLNGGEFCGICGALPKPGRRLNRDHDHRTGMPRGLLCWIDNKFLRVGMTVEWMRSAIAYLERAEEWSSDRAPEDTGSASKHAVEA